MQVWRCLKIFPRKLGNTIYHCSNDAQMLPSMNTRGYNIYPKQVHNCFFTSMSSILMDTERNFKCDDYDDGYGDGDGDGDGDDADE